MLELPHRCTVLGQEVQWGRIGSGPPLVALHGTPFSSQVWRRILPHLAGRWSVFYYDMPGYGRSAMHEGQDVSLGVQNRILAALLQEWGLERPDVLAHDFGGATALRGYYLDGLRYRSLTIFDAVALAPWGSPFVRHVRHHEAAFSGLPEPMHRALLETYLRGAAHRPLTDEALALYASPWWGAVGQAAFYRQVAQMDQRFTDAVEGRYGRLDCPVTVLWGQEDRWIPLAKGIELAARISDRPPIVVPEAGHLVQEDCPEILVATLLGGVAR